MASDPADVSPPPARIPMVTPRGGTECPATTAEPTPTKRRSGIILGFNAMSAERESGTLRQLLSLGVSTRALLLGKATALAASVAILLIPGFVFLAVMAREQETWHHCGAFEPATLRLLLLPE